MTVIADFSIPTDQFVLAHTNATVQGIDIEVERMVANTNEGLAPYFHVSGDNLSGLEQALADDPSITEVTLLEDFETERFYRAHWSEPVEGFMPAVKQADAAVQSATCQDGHWELRLLSDDREQLGTFYERYRQSTDLGLLRVFERSNPVTYGEFGITENQRNTIIEALEMGYFEVPKQTSIEKVADKLGVSPQATSQRLRRGQKNLLMNTLGTHEMSE